MDFNYSEEDEKFRQEVRDWLAKNKPDQEFDEELEDIDEDEAFRRRLNWYKKMATGGWTGVAWPKEYGGRGATLLQQVVFSEELDRAGVTFPQVGLGLMLIGPTLMHWGTEEQKKKHLPGILSGEQVWAQGYSEPNHGSDLAALETRAVDEGDYFVVNGAKVWTSGAQYAQMQNLLVRTDPEAPKHKGISYLLVDLKSPGITIRPLVQITGHRGFNQVFYDNVRVPKENLVGEKNNGWQVAITTLMFERNGGGGRGHGKMVEQIAELAKNTRRNGKSAWEDSAVRQKLAEFACEAEALKYTGMRQLTRQLKGLPPGPEGSMLKLVGSELMVRMQMFAVELCGPYGQLEFRSKYGINNGIWSQRLMASRSGCIAGGSNQIQKNIIGERVLGLAKG